ncbi:hypothetical protein MMU07_10255 [Aquiflexum sp. LQ15W]|uniref:hypothetical protein n=1 Tax=Cognataquiflexum nitidum TaxID=2922272 RepID=UPI001F147B06|nr:hypothetical protein [Cognataquiflexum nitidum]MCH6199966.1 hypothetical protein [Cognataquiflexum nitidum]
MKTSPFIILLIWSFSCKQALEKTQPFIKGVYGNPATLLDAGYRFDSLGMNAVFVRSISLNREFYNTARQQGAKVFVEFPTLNGKEYLQDHPEAWPITDKGKKAEPADWFMGICPTDPNFKNFREEQLKDILGEFEVDGIFLDYVHWHAQFETKNPILPETCFCDRCTGQFGESMRKKIPGDSAQHKAEWILNHADKEWRNWRSGVLNGWVRDMGSVLHEIQPNAKLGVFYCSWYPTDYDSALYRILGIDPKAFSEMADVMSPMLFHKMKERPTTWVGDYVKWLGDLIGIRDMGSKSGDLNQRYKSEEQADRSKPEDLNQGFNDVYKSKSEDLNYTQIWPIVQSHNSPDTVSPEEFRKVMIEGSRTPASGIMMFSDQSLVENPNKINVMKKLYREEIN